MLHLSKTALLLPKARNQGGCSYVAAASRAGVRFL